MPTKKLQKSRKRKRRKHHNRGDGDPRTREPARRYRGGKHIQLLLLWGKPFIRNWINVCMHVCMCMLCSSTGTNSSPKEDGEDILAKVLTLLYHLITIANISYYAKCVCVCVLCVCVCVCVLCVCVCVYVCVCVCV